MQRHIISVSEEIEIRIRDKVYGRARGQQVNAG